MSKQQLLEELLRLPAEDRHDVIARALAAIEREEEALMPKALREKLDTRYAEYVQNPGDELSLDELRSQLQRSRARG